MRRVLIAALAGLCGGGLAAARGSSATTAVVIELFTSEGCSSCPPADQLLERLAAAGAVDGADIVALGEHVDYWDRQGWTDRFSSPAFTARQQVYARRFNDQSAYTPQMVVDGGAAFVGSDMHAARRAIARAAALPHGVIRIVVGAELGRPAAAPVPGAEQAPPLRVTVNVTGLPPIGRGDRAEILAGVTEDQLQSHVRGGENHGRVLTHAAVVRRLATIGEAEGTTASAEAAIAVSPEWRRDRVKIVAFVQRRRDRAILASGAVPLVARR